MKRHMITKLLLCVLGMTLLMGCSGKNKETETQPQTETESQIPETEMPEMVYVSEGQDIVNILLVGKDAREGETVSRSDAMILATINRKKQTMTLTSFMRDTYLSIPNWGSNRLNAAYAFGGRNLLNETFAENFKIQVDGNVEIDFKNFEKLIDGLGGVDITVSEEEYGALHLTEADLLEPADEETDTYRVHLDGEKTLSYARMRSIDNDFERTGRQRKVLQALFDQMKGLNTLEMLEFADKLLKLVESNLKDEQLLGLAAEAMTIGGNTFETYNIPEDAGYTSQSIDGMSVLVPDLEACRVLLETILGE